MRVVCAGVLLALGNAMRPMVIVVIGAVVFVEVLQWVREASLREFSAKALLPLLRPVVVVVVYVAVGAVLSFAVRVGGLNPNGLSNQFPTWKFVVGFNYEASGKWNLHDDTYLFHIADFDEREARAREVLLERLTENPARLPSLLLRKTRLMWATPDDAGWAFGHLGYGRRISFLQDLSMAFVGGSFALFALGGWVLFKRQDTQSVPLLLTVIFLFYFGAHLLIEVQERYRDFGMIFVFILGAYGVEFLRTCLDHSKKCG